MIILGAISNFQGLIKYFNTNLASLRNFQFSPFNLVFWVFLIVVFLLLLKFWVAKKSFSFCLAIAIVLLGTTKLERLVSTAIVSHGETFDPLVFRIAAIFFIAVVWLYYGFIKSDR